MGHVIRYVSPMQVQEFATFLPSLLLTYSDLRAWLETAGYRDPFIFKAMFNDTWALIEMLIPFYEEVAGYNEGVFVRMDDLTIEEATSCKIRLNGYRSKSYRIKP